MKLSSQLYFFALLLASYFFQQLVIYPIETYLRNDEYVEIASLVYLPHGMKVIYAVMLGPLAAIHIFLSQYLSGGFFFGFSNINFIGSVLGTIAIIIPVLLINASAKRPIFSAPLNHRLLKISVIWTYISFTLFAALINSILQMKFYINVADNDILIYFIIGDFIGAIVVFSFFLFIYRPIMNRILLGK